MTKAKKTSWEEKYWEMWEKDSDLTHLDDDILAFIRQELKRERQEAIKETIETVRDSFYYATTFDTKVLVVVDEVLDELKEKEGIE